MRFKSFLLLFCSSVIVYAQDPYAKTKAESSGDQFNSIVIEPNIVNVVSGIFANVEKGMEKVEKNYMYLWIDTPENGESKFVWNLLVEKSGIYNVAGVVYGKGAELTLECGTSKVQKSIKTEHWTRMSFNNVVLTKGVNRLIITAKSKTKFRLSTLELIKASVSKKLTKKANRMRRQPNWFRDAGYGLMFQWTNRSTPEKGERLKSWEEKVNQFDVDRFVNMVDASGATYVIWSATWGEQYISAPIKSLERHIAGRTTTRDLLGKLADKLHAKNIKLIFYYHYGYDCYHSKDSVWMKKIGGYEANKENLYDNIMNVVGEVGKRYGDKLDGWFFDGGQRYYDSHFDRSTEGLKSVSFLDFTQIARKGNRNRIVAYNSWILPMLTQFQDYFAGEDLMQFNDLEEGRFSDGRNKGLMAHTCFRLEKRWGHIDPNRSIAPPLYDLDELVERVQQAQENRYPLSINLEMYEDGSVSDLSSELLRALKVAIRD